MSTVVIVPKDIARRADGLINSGVSASVIKGVELLLQENLHIDGGSGLPAINQLDCSALLKKGSAALQNVPFDLLGVDINCRTVDVRKAYKKLALKYHPDKNPKTTPLFQLIQAASTKLSDSDQRAREAASSAQKRGAAGMRPENRSSAASFHNAFQKNQAANGGNPTSFPSATGAKPSAAPTANNQQSSNSQNPYSQANPGRGSQQTSSQPQPQQQYAYQQYHFNKQQQPQSKPQPTPNNIYGQPQQASYNAQYQQYMNQQRSSNPPQPQTSSQQPQSKPFDPSNNSNKGRNYYEELLKEQYKKAAAAEERAREYANRRFAEQQQKFAGAGGPNAAAAGAANNPFDYRSAQQQQSHPNLNPFRQANQQPAGSVPTANGNPVNVPSSYDWKYAAAGNGPSNNNNNGNNSSNAPSGGGSANTARTYRAGADGKVHVQQSFPAASAAAAAGAANNTNNSNPNPTNQRRLAVPKPYDFKFTSVSPTVVELEWKTSQMHHCNLAVEFSWKEKFPNFTAWEIVEKLIRAGCCRKKNLKPKGSYEFRVRSVEELSNGQLGNRSDWSEVLSIVLPTVEQANYNPLNPTSQTQQQPSTLPKMKVDATGNVEPTPTPDVTDSYGKKSSAATKAAAAAAQKSTVSTQQPSSQPTTSPTANAPTAANVEKPPVNKEKVPSTSKETTSGASSKPSQVRPRTPTQEKPPEEKVFKRFSSKSTLSKDDSGIFSPAQFQLNEKDLKPRSLDDSGPLQKKHSIQHNTNNNSNNNAASSSTTTNGPIEKSLNKYFSGKDKAMSSSQREAWGKQQQQQQQSNVGEDKPNNKAVRTHSKQEQQTHNSSGDDYSNDGFDEDVSEEEEEEVVRVDLDHAGRTGQKSSASSLEDALLGALPSHTNKTHAQHRKRDQDTNTAHKQDGNDDDDDEDDILDESEQQTDSDYSSVASYQTGSKKQASQQRKLRPRREKKSASRASYPINNTTGVKLDAHGNPFEYFELDSSYDHMDTDEIQYYTLQPPSIGNGMSNNALLGSKKTPLSPVFGKEGQTQVNYRHPVHAEPYLKSTIKGYVKGDRAIVGCANCGDWVRVKIQMAVYDASRRDANGLDGNGDPGSARKKAVGKAVWGWCLRTDGTHEFLRPIQGTRHSMGGALGSNNNGSSQVSLASMGQSVATGFTTPLKQQSVTPAVSQHSSQQTSSSSSKKKMMSPPKESLQRGMTKANLGASAILNQSFFNLPKQTPTKEKLKKKHMPSSNSSAASRQAAAAYPSIDERDELESMSVHRAQKAASKRSADKDKDKDKDKTPVAQKASVGTPQDTAEEQVEVWMECFDDQGHVYYYHEQSMVSKWELPEWVEEEDDVSGAKYYVHAVGYGDNITMTSTWTKPKKFARLIRSQAYAS